MPGPSAASRSAVATSRRCRRRAGASSATCSRGRGRRSAPPEVWIASALVVDFDLLRDQYAAVELTLYLHALAGQRRGPDVLEERGGRPADLHRSAERRREDESARRCVCLLYTSPSPRDS